MGTAINPEKIKRREYWGLSGTALGIMLCLIGVIGLLFAWPYQALTLSAGGLSLAIGTGILISIPDLIHTPDESY